MTWQLRRAGAAAVDAIMALESRIFATDAWSAEAMARDVADPNCYYLVAFPPDSPDRIEAYAGLLAPRGAREGDVQTIAVTEHARGHGLGRTLMLSLIAEARKRGVREVFLEVRADNPSAQELYRRLGFEEIGVRRGYYQPDNVDAIVMRLDVPLPVSSLTPEPLTPEPLTSETLAPEAAE
ncbi:ribosomal-protein-alanine N-acetyltransferase [Cryobacterium sp. TMT2-10]|uniref:ribosomal protein S18-alanine N-acetyltransferase n=1 Tax=Cryobacterium sp. TMT2-10 TaxID=1259244 RepID=UPI00106BD2AF|nr:ribosomal protein S18-alanine N-acetyltransferase [Cryobacterium sp. TMT2-10]TFD39251.1 ribosomal-protein-alanine N-acetyltransferase [Cryobacterium sp. TMT2-10]